MSQWGPPQGYGPPPQGYPPHGYGPPQLPPYAPLQLPPGYLRCPFCGWTGLPLTHQTTSTGAWVFFVVLLIMCFPLCWIPLVTMKDRTNKCGSCMSRIGS